MLFTDPALARFNFYELLFRGTIKDKVFARKPRTVEDMIQFILKACQEIDAGEDLCFRACMSVRSRLEECMNADGKQLEYLRIRASYYVCFLLHVVQRSFFV